MASTTYITSMANAATLNKEWLLVDAENETLGRLASKVAMLVRGKHKPTFTPHVDTGDHVVVINAEKVALTGKKRENKIYYRHTGHPGGVKERVAGKVLDGAHPERVVEKAVERMMPKESPLAARQLAKLRVYAGAEHPHVAQNPTTIDFKSKNRKNSRIG